MALSDLIWWYTRSGLPLYMICWVHDQRRLLDMIWLCLHDLLAQDLAFCQI